MATIYDVADRVNCHAYNSDRNMLAISTCGETVTVLRKGSKDEWQLVQNLEEHTERVTGVDWAPKSNRLLTCASDRNAFVWDASGQNWSPQMVVLRADRAATCCKWSPNERKFAIGTGSKLLAVCHYNAAEKWWLSRHVRKSIISTVLCVAWHPSNMVVACGGCDMKVRVFCAYLKEEDGPFQETSWKDSAEKEAGKFGSLLAEFANESTTHKGGWVNAVAFSPDGCKLCWASHDSSIRIADSLSQKVIVELTAFLPFTSVLWCSFDRLIAAGFSCFPVVYSFNVEQSKLTLCGKLHQAEKQDEKKIGAMAAFQQSDWKGEVSRQLESNSVHKSCITDLRHFEGTANECTQFSSAGIDGRVVIWNLQELQPEAFD